MDRDLCLLCSLMCSKSADCCLRHCKYSIYIWINEPTVRIRDLSAPHPLGTSIIKTNKYRPNLGTYCLATRKGARLQLVWGPLTAGCSGWGLVRTCWRREKMGDPREFGFSQNTPAFLHVGKSYSFHTNSHCAWSRACKQRSSPRVLENY